MIDKLDPSQLDFNEIIEALWGISCLCVKHDTDAFISSNDQVQKLLDEIEVYTFERSDNHLQKKQYDLLVDFYNALNLYNDKAQIQLKNRNLKIAVEGPEFHSKKFVEG